MLVVELLQHRVIMHRPHALRNRTHGVRHSQTKIKKKKGELALYMSGWDNKVGLSCISVC